MVEDDFYDGELIKREILSAGFEATFQRVFDRSGFRDALASTPDVILVDYHLPQFDLFEAIDIAQDGGCTAPFIVVTGSVGEELAVECIKRGAADYVLKDSLARLPRALTSVLEQRELKAAHEAASRELEAAQNALKENEQRYRSLVQNSRDSVTIVDANGSISYTTPAIEDITGYTPQQMLGSKAAFWIHPEETSLVAETFRSVAAGSSAPCVTEFRLRRKGGGWVWAEGRFSDLSSDPAIRGTVVNIHDITLRKLATNRLLESERLLAQAEAMSHIGSFSWNVDTDAVKCSHELYRIFGFEPGPTEPALQTLFAAVHDEDSQPLVEAIQGCLSSGEGVAYDFRAYLPDGRVRRLNLHARLLDSDEPTVVGTVRDETEKHTAEKKRREMEQELRASEQRFRGAFEGANTGMVLISPDGSYLDVNPFFCQMLGYSKEQLLRMTWKDVTHPEDLPLNLVQSRSVLEGKEDFTFVKKRYVHKDGHVVWAEVSDALVRGSGDRPDYLVTQVQDVSERIRLQEQLRQAQKLEAIGQLAGGVAHDFNNLLAVVLSYARVLLEDTDDDDPRKEDLNEILRAGERGAALTRQLLMFSRKEVVKPIVLDLNQVVLGMEKMLSRTIRESIDLEITAGKDLWPIVADAGHVEQILMNLAVNARDAMQKGGRLMISTRNVVITASDATRYADLAPGEYAQLEISDTGKGIDPEIQDRIFEPFFTTKARGEGTGLGLSTVYGIVKQSGGEVVCRSEPGTGTTFLLLLPRARVSSVTAARSNDASPVRGNGEHILLVEDEDSVRHMTQRVLERGGYSVTASASGVAALERMAEMERPPDLLVTDLIMPGGISGKELAERLKLPTVLMSGYTDNIIEDAGGLKPEERFLPKPFTSAALLEIVAETLSARSAHIVRDAR